MKCRARRFRAARGWRKNRAWRDRWKVSPWPSLGRPWRSVSGIKLGFAWNLSDPRISERGAAHFTGVVADVLRDEFEGARPLVTHETISEMAMEFLFVETCARLNDGVDLVPEF